MCPHERNNFFNGKALEKNNQHAESLQQHQDGGIRVSQEEIDTQQHGDSENKQASLHFFFDTVGAAGVGEPVNSISRANSAINPIIAAITAPTL